MISREEVNRLVRYFCCEEGTARYGPYFLVGQNLEEAATELVRGRLYRYRLVDDQQLSVDLHVYIGLAGVGGELWDREVRVLLRTGQSGLPGLPSIRDGGYQDSDSAAKAGVRVEGFAVVATEGSDQTLADEGALEQLRKNKVHALVLFKELADALAEPRSCVPMGTPNMRRRRTCWWMAS